ncbi:MT-A70-domain-containing protein, partial [Sphaerosporella brunnea]
MSAPAFGCGPYANEIPDRTVVTKSLHVVNDGGSDNAFNELALLDPDFVPASTIVNADDKNDGPYTGASLLLRGLRLKQEHVAKSNNLTGNIGFTVHWNEMPWSIIEALEGSGKSPTLWEDRCRESILGAQDRKNFDPKAPHFDVVLISLLDSPWFPQVEYLPSEGLPPTALDHLPVESLLGRPGFVILHVGGTVVGKTEGQRLFHKWGVKTLETVVWLPTDLKKLHPNQKGRSPFRMSSETWFLGMRGAVNRSADTNIITCNLRGDVLVSKERPDMEAFAEQFVNGQRRLHLFAPAGPKRPGWVRVGKNLETDFDCR